MRPDLLALTSDDLASIANRGLLKRAGRDLEADDIIAEWQENEDGTIIADWSDDVTCVLPGDKTVDDSECNCPATGVCRHLIRTVLAWQQKQLSTDETGTTEVVAETWDPGRITDDQIAEQVPKPVQTRANTLWKQGILAELLRSSKPSARFHTPGHTVRFPVPDDLRYARCSCSDPAPCVHSILAVRAFRLLDQDVDTGIVHEGTTAAKTDPAPLQAAVEALSDLLDDGFSGLNTTWRDRIRRIAADCLKAGFVWPAEILEDLAVDFEKYSDRDSAFSPGNSVHQIGEFLLRSDAIQSGVAPVPQAFIRGTKTDRDTSLGAARFVGLGGVATEYRNSTAITVFLQENDTGHPVSVTRETKEDPASERSAKPFHELARMPAVKDASLALLAAGQLVTQGGKRKASGKLMIGRARAAVNPQNFAWEKLKAPVLVEDANELNARINLLPPASFRPRSTAGDFHVCPLKTVEQAWFDPVSNSVAANLTDPSGNEIQLSHSWTDRGKSGAEFLLAALTLENAKPKFIAGHVRNFGNALTFRPTAYVFEDPDGNRRAVMPWLESPESASKISGPKIQASPTAESAHGPYQHVEEIASEILLNGLRRITRRDSKIWSRAIAQSEATGHHRMGQLLEEVVATGTNHHAAVLSIFRILTLAADITNSDSTGSSR